MHREIARRRLFNQHIAGERLKTPEEVVRWMGALQAQEYRQAAWAIALRTQGATAMDVEQAIAERKIVRTWPLRGTLHFVPAEDAKWMVGLSAARILASDRRRLAQLELDEATIERAKQLLHRALQGGNCLARPTIMKLFEDAGISTTGQRGYHLLWSMAQHGMICLGPLKGKQQTFVLLDEWVPGSHELSREAALAELARRYFVSHGPATVQDFAWWASLTLTDARAGLAAVTTELRAETIDGQEYWLAKDAPDQHTPLPSASTYLLPGFDEYFLGYKTRDAIVSAEHMLKVVPGNNGIFLPMLVVAGQVVGTWKDTQRKNALGLFLKPFISLDHLADEATTEARRYSNFLGLSSSAITIQEP